MWTPGTDLSGLRRPASKVLDAKSLSDNVLHTNLRPSSEGRVRACPGLLMPTSVHIPLYNIRLKASTPQLIKICQRLSNVYPRHTTTPCLKSSTLYPSHGWSKSETKKAYHQVPCRSRSFITGPLPFFWPKCLQACHGRSRGLTDLLQPSQTRARQKKLIGNCHKDPQDLTGYYPSP